MTKTKVLFLARRFAPHIGGVETHLAQITDFLHQKPYEVTIVTEQDDRSEPTTEVIQGAKVRRISLPHEKTSKLPIWAWFLFRPGVLLGADIIHVHDVFFWILPFYPLLRLWRKKIYITFHGYEAPGPLTKQQIFWHRLAARWSLGNICVGGFHQKYYGVKPTVVTYGGVAELNHSTKFAARNAQKIVFVGRLAKDTGILEYLSALQLLQSEHKPFHLDIFGDGELHADCEKFIQANKLNVTIHGYVPNATAQFDKYPIVFASQYLSILAAMSHGCAVIAYADTAIKKDYLQLTPFVEWISVTHSAAEIAQAVKNAQPMHKHGVGWAKKQTWEKLGKEYLDLWHNRK